MCGGGTGIQTRLSSYQAGSTPARAHTRPLRLHLATWGMGPQQLTRELHQEAKEKQDWAQEQAQEQVRPS